MAQRATANTSSPSLAILGSGPKAAALHAQARVLDDLGLFAVHTTSWDAARPAAHWDGRSGLTDGRCSLGTSPLKDVAYPGGSAFGPAVDRELARFSWVGHLRETGVLDGWVDRGCPPCSHREWAGYLRWVLRAADADARSGRIRRVSPDGSGVRITLADGSAKRADGFVYTGPGRVVGLLPAGARHGRVFDGSDFWSRGAFRPGVLHGRVAIVGCGETAAAMLQRLAPLADRFELSVVTPSGLLPTRDESFPTNTWYSRPRDWAELPLETRREVLRSGDRGVLSVAAQAALMAHRVKVSQIRGRVMATEASTGGVELKIESAGRTTRERFDFAISAMGFDVIGPLRELLDPAFGLPDSNEQLMLSIDHKLRVPTERGNIHVPGLAGLAQGPGFPNLSCLALMAGRVLSAYQ